MGHFLRCRSAFAVAMTAAAGALVLTGPVALAGSPEAVAAVATNSYSPTCAHAPMPLPAGESLTVRGNQLMAGGKPFVVHGVIIEGLQAPQAVLAKRFSTDNGKTISLKAEEQARQAWGLKELHAIRCFGANTVRIHIAQPSADPQNAEFSPSHLTEFVNAVKLARQQGLAVIVDMQDEPLSGEHHSVYNPTAATLRAWEKLAPMLANIPGVMLELFNQPLLEASEPNAWNIWLDGGKVTRPIQATTVGVQTMVDKIRGLGADNPIVIMGLLPGNGTGGWTLQGMPPVKDPIKGSSQLVFSVHFPPTKATVGQEEPHWDNAFGNTAARLPVMVGAFNVSSKARCTAQAPQTATDLVTKYLTKKQVGIAGWAFDYPQSIFQLPGAQGALTNFTNFSCEGKGFSGKFGGDGHLLYTAFTAEGNGT
jgi:Cellulase (glycosyl hydrolase family 5)